MAAQQAKGELNPRLYETDRVRLDVGVAGANEIYSWVGEDRFDDRDLFDMVREGALQSGSFSGFLISIFGSDAGACESTTALSYSRVRLYDSEFLLPRETRLDILNTDGSEFRNRTGYANCHEFRGESTLRFETPSPEASSAPPKASAPSPLPLPAGLKLKVVFTEPINIETAATGDRLKAKLASAIRDESSQSILVPKGAEVMARIGGLQHYVGPPSSVTRQTGNRRSRWKDCPTRGGKSFPDRAVRSFKIPKASPAHSPGNICHALQHQTRDVRIP
jgi:hypothetical protein